MHLLHENPYQTVVHGTFVIYSRILDPLGPLGHVGDNN